MSGVGYQRPLLPRDALNWQARAICRDEDPALFEELPRRTTRRDCERVLVAIQVCAECPVRSECLLFGIKNRETGVWGGRYLVEGQARPVFARSRGAA